MSFFPSKLVQKRKGGDFTHEIKIALAGNPNCGKTTVFNALTGSNLYVGNWAGVTVEKKEGRLKTDKNTVLTDLPGIYSLSPYTPEEVIAGNYLLVERPNVILNTVDSSNIERNLYLTLQLLETGIPLVLMLNMTDWAERKGIIIDEKKLSELLGVPIVKASASKGIGVEEAAKEAGALALSHSGFHPKTNFFSPETESALKTIEFIIKQKCPAKSLRFSSVKLFERDIATAQSLKLTETEKERIEAAISRREKQTASHSEEIIISERYNYIEKLLSGCMIKEKTVPTPTEKIDKLLTGRRTALPLFILIMAAVYFLSAGPIGAALSNLLERGINSFANTVELRLDMWNCAYILKSLILKGIIGGVGSVLSFLPQLFLLFTMLSLLEDCGYMARVAFIMDRFFRFFGLSGKSFIPLLIATGCGVPAIMSSRTVDNESGRKMTIITSTFMPCGAKLPLISLISARFFGGGWWVAPICYFTGIFAVLISGLILKNTKPFKSHNYPFIMELPDYRLPILKSIAKTVGERLSSFLKRAGTTIFIASVAVWFLSSFGFSEQGLYPVLYQGDSILFMLGEKIAPLFTPIGFGSWQAAVATLMGLLAKEEIVGVFGVISTDITALFGSGLSAFSFLLFNLLCAPCIAAMSTIAKEMKSPRWTFFGVAYQTVFAYLICFCLYQIGSVFFQ